MCTGDLCSLPNSAEHSALTWHGIIHAPWPFTLLRSTHAQAAGCASVPLAYTTHGVRWNTTGSGSSTGTPPPNDGRYTVTASRTPSRIATKCSERTTCGCVSASSPATGAPLPTKAGRGNYFSGAGASKHSVVATSVTRRLAWLEQDHHQHDAQSCVW
jgi:hypothetical protein